MKECPNCKKQFADDLYYCLYDGTPLTSPSPGFDPSAETEVIDTRPSDPTMVLNRSDAQPPTVTPASKIPYVIIGALMLICVVLAGAFLVTNLDRLIGKREPPAQNVDVAKGATPAITQTPNAGPFPVNTAATTPVIKKPDAAVNPTGKWRGEWSTPSGTMLDIEISLTDAGAGGVEGQIKWTMRKTVRPDKMDKIGLSAVEYVRGTFDPETASITMSGYSKDDPNDVLVMVDDYKLTISPDGKTLSGKARNGGKWNGYLRLTRSSARA